MEEENTPSDLGVRNHHIIIDIAMTTEVGDINELDSMFFRTYV